MVDTNNQNHITRWYQERIDVNHSNQPYIDLELLTVCQIWVLPNTYNYHLNSEYAIPKSTLKHYLEKSIHKFSAEMRSKYIKY